MFKMLKSNTHIAKLSNFSKSLFLPLRKSGVPLDKIIQKLSLKNFDLKDPEKYVPMTLMYDLMTKVDHYVGPPGIVSFISNEFKIQDLGEYGEHILSNPNFLHFLQEAKNYESILATNLKLDLQITGKKSRLSFTLIDLYAPGKEFAVAINLSLMLEGFRVFGGGDWIPLEIQVPGNSVQIFEPVLPYGNYTISYGFSDYAFIFPTQMLTLKNPFQSEYKKIPHLMTSTDKLSDRIEKLLLAYKRGKKSSIKDFSEYFNLSARSIRRQLLKEGTTFSEIKDRTFFLKALELLSTTKYKINEISKYLGYTKSANFIRFFKKYTGASPGEFRTKIILAANDNSYNFFNPYIYLRFFS